MRKELSVILLLLALAATTAIVLFERAEDSTWKSRLAFPDFLEALSRHTPLQTEGTFLPPRLLTNTTLTARDNPVILAGRTEVPAGVALALEDGVVLYAHEFAELSVSGALHLRGSENQSIILTSNERHPQNKIWNGIIVQPGGKADITYAHISDASPALTCLPDSEAMLTNSEIKNTLVGIFTNSPDCQSSNNRIQAIREEYVRTF